MIWDLSAKQRRILRLVGYPLFYAFCLLVFAFLTFPFERVKRRVMNEFNRSQAESSGMRLEIEEMSWYWLSGIEAQGVRLVTPRAPDPEGAPRRPEVFDIADLHVRYSILSALVGSSHVSFGLEVEEGAVEGYIADDEGVRTIGIEFEQLPIAGLPLLSAAVGLPMGGLLSGNVELALPEQKLSKADGTIALEIVDLSVGDGKAKIRDTIALPRLEAGKLSLAASSKSGSVKVEKFTAEGPDLELDSEGKMRLRDPFATSRADLRLRFKFTDRYKTKDDMTKGLFGEPGSSVPGLFDLDPKNKQAKQSDGFYSWRVSGAFARLDFRPDAARAARSKGARGSSTSAARRKARARRPKKP